MIPKNPLNGIIEEFGDVPSVPSIAVGVSVKHNYVHGLNDDSSKKDFFERVKRRKSLTFKDANDSFWTVECFAEKYDIIEIFGGAENLCVSALAARALDYGLNVVIPKKYTFKTHDFNGTVSDIVRQSVHVRYFFSQTPEISACRAK